MTAEPQKHFSRLQMHRDFFDHAPDPLAHFNPHSPYVRIRLLYLRGDVAIRSKCFALMMEHQLEKPDG